MSHRKPHPYSNKWQDKPWVRRQLRRYWAEALAADTEIARENALRAARSARSRAAWVRRRAATAAKS